MSTGIVIQARTGSSRMPNKVLTPFFNGDSILELLIKRIKKLDVLSEIVVATSNLIADNLIEKKVNELGVKCYRGDEKDVLNRFVRTARKYNFSNVIRICADNPFFSIESIPKLIEISKINDKYDYISYVNKNGIPAIKTHLGLYGELITFKTLVKVSELTSENLYKEHVTNFIYSHPEYFRINFLRMDEIVFEREDLRFTVDDKEDFDNLSKLYKIYSSNGEDLSFLINYIDSNLETKKLMIKNINKYNK